MGFLKPNTPLVMSSLDGIDDFTIYQQLGEKPDSGLPFMWHGRLLRGRSGARTDFLSSPKFIKCNLQNTNSAFPTGAHDFFYRGYIDESFDNGVTWTPWKLEQYVKADADCALFDLCEDNFVPPDEAKLIYEAVHEFGQTAWNQDADTRAMNCK